MIKYILFIGDSRGNQQPQQNVADALAKSFKADGVVIAHIGDYYSAHGQTEYLAEQGFSEDDIGLHAGLRDTAEMKFIEPDGLRITPWQVKDRVAGYVGNPNLATKELGQELTALKIKAALNQIEIILGMPGQAKSQSKVTY